MVLVSPHELLTVVSRLHGSLLDRNRPLWEAHLIEGLADGRFALYTKIHHALCDGVTAMRLLESAVAVKPRLPRQPAASGVVTTGVSLGRDRVATRSQWSPCMWLSRTASSAGSCAGTSAGSVSRLLRSP